MAKYFAAIGSTAEAVISAELLISFYLFPSRLENLTKELFREINLKSVLHLYGSSIYSGTFLKNFLRETPNITTN